MRSLHPALAALLPAVLPACSSLQPVLRYPWVEDRYVSLAGESLVVTVRADDIDVDARLAFRQIDGPPLDRILTFPIPAAGASVRNFFAHAERPGFAPVQLPVSPANPGWLPAGSASQTFDVSVAAELLRGRGSVLRFHYRQTTSGLFRYTLKTGAYWAGPIARLDVLVIDPDQCVAVATVEGRRPDRAQGQTLAWTFLQVEPDQGVALEVTR